MNKDVAKVLIDTYRSYDDESRAVLFVDDDLAKEADLLGATRLSSLGFAPEEAWATRGDGVLSLVVLSAPRSAREMFRVLALVERLVRLDGRILLLPVTDSVSDEVRPEATEIFCGAYPEWSRRQVEANVVELRRKYLGESRVFMKRPMTDEDPVRVAEISSAGASGPVVLRGQFLTVEQVTRIANLDLKRVVSLSVFGDSRFGTDFWRAMPEFVTNYVLAHHALFGGYELRIHHDEHLFHSSAGDVLCGLERRGLVKLVYLPSRTGQGKCERMLHRLYPAWDETVGYVVCRDVDSLPAWRDRQAVEEFITSGLQAGTIHDNREHGGMMGGLCHFRASALRDKWPSFDNFVEAAAYDDTDWAVHGADQNYLNRIVSQGAFGTVLEHSLRSRGVQTIPGSRFVERIAPAPRSVVETVPSGAWLGSDALTNYMGSSGYQTALARAFYDNHSPIAANVKDAERFAREAISPGDGVKMSVDERFLSGIDAWCNHRPLLYLALEETAGSDKPVIEMGMGDGSSPFLHDYCEDRGRKLRSYDSDGSWVEQFVHLRSALHTTAGVGQEWEHVHDGTHFSVALVDHAPGERRYVDVERLLTTCDIIVCHDSEPQATGYGFQNIWHLFKYRVDVQSPTAWATAVSNTVDVTKWRGRTVGGWVIS